MSTKASSARKRILRLNRAFTAAILARCEGKRNDDHEEEVALSNGLAESDVPTVQHGDTVKVTTGATRINAIWPKSVTGFFVKNCKDSQNGKMRRQESEALLLESMTYASSKPGRRSA